MATGSVSALDQDTWQLIATNTTTSGSTSTFSSLSGYKEYIIAYEGVSISADGSAKLTFNSNTSNYYGGVHLQNTSGYVENASNGLKLNYSAKRTLLNGLISIKNVNNGAPKIVEGYLILQAGDDYPTNIKGGWTNTDAITSITITTASGTFSAGSMKLYGIAG